jgi:hypothetical protein
MAIGDCFSAGWDSPTGVFILPGAETYLSRPPAQETEATVETVLTTGPGRLIFECGNAVCCLIKWILDYETTCFDFGVGGFGGRVGGLCES